MNVDTTFLPVAVELIDKVFGTDIVFHQHRDAVYDPLTGRITHPAAPPAGPAGPAADWVNSEADCEPLVPGDYNSSIVGDGVVSICDDATLPAGATAFDDADLLPRAAIVLPDSPSTDLTVKAGILSRSRVEEGGPQETYEISVWVQHSTSGLSFLPTTEDTFTYDSVLWKLTDIAPTYSAKGLIASKLTARTS